MARFLPPPVAILLRSPAPWGLIAARPYPSARLAGRMPAMRSPALALALLLLGILLALGGLAVMLLSGFMALLINPHGGLYGGSREEIATFALVSALGGVVGLGGCAGATWAAVQVLRARKKA